ncbi:MAG: hypothetical protein LBF65_01825 [Holosporales bacterium]|nr:hypothetical protein [Holosporales bacterium]
MSAVLCLASNAVFGSTSRERIIDDRFAEYLRSLDISSFMASDPDSIIKAKLVRSIPRVEAFVWQTCGWDSKILDRVFVDSVGPVNVGMGASGRYNTYNLQTNGPNHVELYHEYTNQYSLSFDGQTEIGPPGRPLKGIFNMSFYFQIFSRDALVHSAGQEDGATWLALGDDAAKALIPPGKIALTLFDLNNGYRLLIATLWMFCKVEDGEGNIARNACTHVTIGVSCMLIQLNPVCPSDFLPT